MFRTYLVFFICFLFGVVVPATVAWRFPQAALFPRLLSVAEGVWQAQPFSLAKASFPELQGPVQIAFDNYGIPHIVAQSDADLYFAQGVLTAHFRLFQMDVQTRAGLGRLSEMLGERATKYDRFFVTFGMRESIRSEAKALLADPAVAEVLRSYINGINAYVQRLSYRDWPIEYKLLGVAPEKWNVERVAALLKVMTFSLAGRSNDLRLTKILQSLGSEKTMQLFPEFMPNPYESYFVSTGRSDARKDQNWAFDYVTGLKDFPEFLQPVETNGSNDWAVGPKKSRTGFSILANDTHLGLQLPSVWFETQLISPTTNVYGATFPGAPGIILGLTDKLAWGVTNGTTDVLDWYDVEFKAEDSFEYKFDDVWKTASVVSETVNVKNAEPFLVPVISTDYGVVMDRQGTHGLAARWTAHADSNELKALLKLNHGKSVDDCTEGLKDWRAPIQNFICVDADNISIRHTGRIPQRKSGQGRVVDKAIGQASLWQGDIPFDQLPHELNPERGFVFSANERPVGPSYPFYLGWDYEEPFRGQRIRGRLLDKAKLDGNDFMQMQNDIVNQHALLALPILLKHLQSKDFTRVAAAVVDSLRQWDYFERARSFEPSVFYFWWKSLEADLWNEVNLSDRPFYPRRARTLWFFSQLEADPEKYKSWLQPFGSLDELVTKSFHEAIDKLAATYGEDPAKWFWSNVNVTRLSHVAKFPGFGSEELTMDGGQYSILANKGNHGPAWKLVVEMGPNLRAWSQFPGGVTGNPLDPEYEKFLDGWSRGEMRIVRFWRDAHEAQTNSMYVWRWDK